ncbi:MAG: hypothetical protein PVJ40_09545 [Gammaproteobacteria bacterium]|jgi:hypothetical protein
MRRLLLPAAALLLSIAPLLPADAADFGWYAGLAGTPGSPTTDSAADTVDANTYASQAFIGYRSTWMAFEGGYVRLGDLIHQGSSGTRRYALNGKTLGFVADLELGSSFSVYGRWARVWWNSDLAPVDNGGSDQLRGIGLRAQLSRNLFVTWERQRFTVNEIAIDSNSLGLALRF